MIHDFVTVSAPGKIHLLGEHSVVYGFPALLSAVDRRVYVEISGKRKAESGKENRKYEIETIVKNNHPEFVSGCDNNEFISNIVEVFKKEYKIEKLSPIEISINSQIPEGSGMGSSASIAAGLVGALMKYVKNIWNPVKINELAFKIEKLSHGNPSGADNTTVVFGGLVWYRREFDFLKSIWSLPISSYKIPKFAVLNSGRPSESTKEMVEMVRRNYSIRKTYFDDVFRNQEIQTKKLLLSLKTGDFISLKESIIKGENNLEKIGVVGKKAKGIVREIEKLGGAAKICGAGGREKGSGIILCFHSDLSKLKMLENKLDVKLESISLGEEGIRIEKQAE
jgi:mevalonate kinase